MRGVRDRIVLSSCMSEDVVSVSDGVAVAAQFGEAIGSLVSGVARVRAHVRDADKSCGARRAERGVCVA